MIVENREPMVGAEPAKVARGAAPLITVAICTRNRADFLSGAIAAVLSQLTADSELLLVDNGSTDNTAQIVAKAAEHPQVREICEKELGLSAARNAALASARGRYVLFLDDDAVPEPGWLAAFSRFLSSPPSERVGVVGSAVWPNYEAPPPRWLNPAFHRFDLGNTVQRIQDYRSFWGGNSAYRRDAAIQAGQFNRNLGRKGAFLGAHEELDLNMRLRDAGFEMWWLPGAPVRHHVPAERNRLKWLLRSEFAASRTRALIKCRVRSRRIERFCYAAGRILIAPFHCLLQLLGALLIVPFSRRIATKLLLRVAGVAGLASGLIRRAIAQDPRTNAESHDLKLAGRIP